MNINTSVTATPFIRSPRIEVLHNYSNSGNEGLPTVTERSEPQQPFTSSMAAAGSSTKLTLLARCCRGASSSREDYQIIHYPKGIPQDKYDKIQQEFKRCLKALRGFDAQKLKRALENLTEVGIKANDIQDGCGRNLWALFRERLKVWTLSGKPSLNPNCAPSANMAPNRANEVFGFLYDHLGANHRDAQGNTVAHLFAEEGNDPALVFLEGLGANLSIKNKQGKTPFDVLADTRGNIIE